MSDEIIKEKPEEPAANVDEELSAPEKAAEAEPAASEETAGTGEETAGEPSLAEQLAQAQAEAADYKDRWMRSQAEFANARKRMEKERADAYTNAKADIVLKLLPALDDFERALTNAPEAIRADSWYEGIELVEKKLQAVLEGLNVTPVAAVGEPFDPNWHEAISQEPSDEHESGIVSRELQKGYKIGDRVIRPSLVVVSE